MSSKKNQKSIPIFVIHSGNQERRKHIEKELAKKDLSFEFVLDGNQEDLTPQVLKKYFSNITNEFMGEVSPKTSCAYKHILVYEKIIKKKIKQAIIFEDDIVLHDDFLTFLNKISVEIKKRNLTNYLISLENSSLYIVTRPKKGVYLYYKQSSQRGTGAALISYECAHNIVKYIKEKKCYFPIDWMQTALAKKDLINIYWAHPTIAEQNSYNGKFDSLLDPLAKKSTMRRVNHFYKKVKIKFIYLFHKVNFYLRKNFFN